MICFRPSQLATAWSLNSNFGRLLTRCFNSPFAMVFAIAGCRRMNGIQPAFDYCVRQLVRSFNAILPAYLVGLLTLMNHLISTLVESNFCKTRYSCEHFNPMDCLSAILQPLIIKPQTFKLRRSESLYNLCIHYIPKGLVGCGLGRMMGRNSKTPSTSVSGVSIKDVKGVLTILTSCERGGNRGIKCAGED